MTQPLPMTRIRFVQLASSQVANALLTNPLAAREIARDAEQAGNVEYSFLIASNAVDIAEALAVTLHNRGYPFAPDPLP